MTGKQTSDRQCLCGNFIDKEQAKKVSIDGFRDMCETCHEHHEEMAKGPDQGFYERLNK
jgi:hypothetical protein